MSHAWAKEANENLFTYTRTCDTKYLAPPYKMVIPDQRIVIYVLTHPDMMKLLPPQLRQAGTCLVD